MIIKGFNYDGLENYTKIRRFCSPDVNESRSYKTDKWYNIKRDELTDYYERFFLDKVKKKLKKNVEKLRKKNESEKGK